jgi:hypothetical protein
VIWPSSSARDENRHERSVRISDGAKAPKQLAQALLIFFHNRLAIQAECFHSFLRAWKVFRNNPPELRTAEAESISERDSAFALAYPRRNNTRKHMPVKGLTRSGRIRLPKVDV